MPVIDCHVHLYPPELNRDPAAWAAASGERHWATLCTRRRADGRPVQGFPEQKDLLRELDRAGIDRAVLLGWYWENPATCLWQNRFLAECVQAYPDRLAAFASVHPGAGEESALAEIEWARDEGLSGLGELSPHAQGYRVDDPVFSAVLDRAGQLQMPVNLHVTDPMGRAYPGRIETPLTDFVRLACSFRETTFLLAHWGGLLPTTALGGEAREAGNLYYDTAASPLLYDTGVWPRMFSAVGCDRVLFGSDYPLNLYPRSVAGSGLAEFVAEAKAGGADASVLGGNAARLLKW